MCERNWLAPSSFGAARDRVEPDASSCSRVARLRDLERPLADSPIPAAAKARCLAPPREADPGVFLMSSSQTFGKVFELQYRVSFALVLSHLVLSKLSVFVHFHQFNVQRVHSTLSSVVVRKMQLMRLRTRGKARPDAKITVQAPRLRQ